MRIGFDVSQTAERMAGCGIVADQLLRHLVETSRGDTFIPYPVFGNYRNPHFRAATCPRSDAVVTHQFDLSWEHVTAPWIDGNDNLFEFLGRPEIIHANNYSCPRNLGAPLVYTIYDLSALEAAAFHKEQNRMNCFDGLFEASLHAAHLVAISHDARARFLRWFPHVDADRISVIHLAARPSLTAPIADLRPVLDKFHLEQDGFWLAVGTIEPRKNYAALLEAYAEVRARAPGRVMPLCIAGLSGWLESSLEPRIAQLGLGDMVRCLGFVDDQELAALYRTCFAFVYPSRYEGFGLPVIEAMACGAAVIATRSTSLPEVVGDAGWLVDVEAPGGYAHAMWTLLSDAVQREELRAAAVARAAQFSWSKGAVALRQVYESVVNHEPARFATPALTMPKRRIAVDVTPILSGGSCGGAKPFVLELLRGLASSEGLSFELFTAAHNHEDFAGFESLGMKRWRAEGPGPVGLFDAGIDLLFCPMTAPTFAEAGVPTVCTLYDLQHLAYPWLFAESELIHRTRFYQELVKRADHVACISEFSRRNLVEQLHVPADRTSVVPIAIHQRLQPRPAADAWALLSRFGLSPCRFAFYPANFWRHKNHRLLLVAFERFIREHPSSDLHLVLSGEQLTEGTYLESVLARMGLAERVHVLGFVSDSEMEALWTLTEFLVFPSLYEGFGIPVLEALHFGKPVISSREGSLPEVGGDDVMYFDAHDPGTLVTAFERMGADPGAAKRRALAAQVRLANSDPISAADQYARIFARVISQAPRRPTQALPQRWLRSLNQTFVVRRRAVGTMLMRTGRMMSRQGQPLRGVSRAVAGALFAPEIAVGVALAPLISRIAARLQKYPLLKRWIVPPQTKPWLRLTALHSDGWAGPTAELDLETAAGDARVVLTAHPPPGRLPRSLRLTAYVDGKRLGTRVAGAGSDFSVDWPLNGVAPGRHTLRILANTFVVPHDQFENQDHRPLSYLLKDLRSSE